ncbi:esterase-like activity of phytase family protein [Marinibacterium sp. SX1]|uniref:esterase-like activity of phytase family protein n=1 Tax=Marinibacterium sp. SX1 TaxID=3388424 RepID=UPI003D174366
MKPLRLAGLVLAVFLCPAILALAVARTAAQTADDGLPRAELIGALTLTHPGRWFGGFSGIDLRDTGTDLLLLGDRGRWARARLVRRDGQAVAAEGWTSARIKDPDGRPWPRGFTDAEGLARLPDGTLCLSYEGETRVDCHARPDAPAHPLPRIGDFGLMPENGGLEALAADDRGRLYTLSEQMRSADGRIPVYRWDGQAWSVVLHLPDQGGFVPVGADIHDGQLYLLLRRFSGIGFRSRLIRLPLPDGASTAPVTPQVLLQTGPGTHDNLEGVSVWRDGDGRLIATMISDDNLNWFQRTELVEYLLPEPPGAAAHGAARQRADSAAQGARQGTATGATQATAAATHEAATPGRQPRLAGNAALASGAQGD